MSDPETPPQPRRKQQQNVMQEGRLYDGELFWRDHQHWLETHGYTLRKRYHPGWVASWLTSPTEDFWFDCEDSMNINANNIMDATRRDGSHVALKHINVSLHPDEAAIGQLFCSEPLASDPANHCIPILDVLRVPDDDTVILIMPLLYDNEIPPFETIGEVVEFFRQIFEGLQFMHKHHVAHRDCKYDNIMGDVASLYKTQPHPWRPWKAYDFSGNPKQRSSRTRTPIKYYLVDFGLSRLYEPEDAPHLEPPGWGGYSRLVPEFQNSDEPCDPFPVDVYFLGNAIRENFLDGDEDITAKKGFEFMRELVSDMVKDDPKQRPSMDEVVSRFAVVVERLSNWKLRSRVAAKDERPLRGVVRSIVHWTKQAGFMARRIPAIPKA
ncbi:hypothetical protein Hypma_007493 [Hypsizygus marmoreus]|uniref:Protein kinase domain-containing protein n=1 Tax=Hypsizygus marmoreus TaxID=39966 RepID=A0A369JYM3_HYPMA|nr:hypothetical protein Hypma_007493 [Hypsizygus marmoreus]